ncbi:hypothetical protein BDK51DRAFT_18207 [Blyttiomyces helicus]|uniref:Phosphoglycerate dehydrogenase n=1 Tax=Blyttiomyces helicus TaxID=388810 RepID=A0A4P9WGU5_9FUNG|nr:hypothetical protein BDK51DRAFT_18207 [Blyttiomyces helicus]|eukprot:RKO91934.1 hypothetical protein BDK51DRAFT_18207 [Blyttiomyces helicus]
MTSAAPSQKLSKRASASVLKALRPFNSGEIKVLLLEGVNPTGIKVLTSAGYQVESHAKALAPDVLKEKIKDVHVVGLRSKTQLTAEILAEAKNLLTIGCFCIGTNQVDLEYAASHGISVFNSPFSNSRSVAELVIAEIIALSRQIGDRSNELHKGQWNKTSTNCHEIRGKTLGIVGYGHIGSQLSVLADSMGMKVLLYDTLQLMPLGTAHPVGSLEELLGASDFVTLHVPETDETKNMISDRELELMRKGSYLINASRGSVVDIAALAKKLQNGHLAGAAVDVYPAEPFANGPGFETPLIGCPNTILTPHIGGSTEEAQSSIGIEVATALTRYLNNGTTLAAVNFPECDIRTPTADQKTVRILNCHHNVPGVLKQVNKILSEFNIEKQICDSRGGIAYLIADIVLESDADLRKVYDSISAIPENIRTRLLY